MRRLSQRRFLSRSRLVLLLLVFFTSTWHIYDVISFELQYRQEGPVEQTIPQEFKGTAGENRSTADDIHPTDQQQASSSSVQRTVGSPPQTSSNNYRQSHAPRVNAIDGTPQALSNSQRQRHAPRVDVKTTDVLPQSSRNGRQERHAPRVVCYTGNQTIPTLSRDCNGDCFEVPKKGERKILVYPAKRFIRASRMSNPYMNQTTCVPAAPWQTVFHPNCNAFHEVDMISFLNNKKENLLTMLGSGGWRTAWKVQQHNTRETVVLKTLKWFGQNFDKLTYHRHHVDAIATERLSASNYAIGIYGYCGESSYNEVARMTLTGAVRKLTVNKTTHSWALSLPQRVCYARDAALAVAELYDNHDVLDYHDSVNASAARRFATIVHRDIKPDNFVLVKDGTLKLNDFNDGELIKYNRTSQGPCYFRRHRWSPYYKSPEEAYEFQLSPAVDIYALGGVLYFLLTGHRPFDSDNKTTAFKHLASGELPSISSKYKHDKHPAVRAMIQLIHACWSLYPSRRPLARDVATELTNLLKDMEKMQRSNATRFS